MVDKNGKILPPQAVKLLLESKGVNLEEPVVISCGWGITVCVLYLATQNLASKGEIKRSIYDGSWDEYSKRSDQGWLKSFM